jgi:hypothetical protein
MRKSGVVVAMTLPPNRSQPMCPSIATFCSSNLDECMNTISFASIIPLMTSDVRKTLSIPERHTVMLCCLPPTTKPITTITHFGSHGSLVYTMSMSFTRDRGCLITSLDGLIFYGPDGSNSSFRSHFHGRTASLTEFHSRHWQMMTQLDSLLQKMCFEGATLCLLLQLGQFTLTRFHSRNVCMILMTGSNISSIGMFQVLSYLDSMLIVHQVP